MTEYDRGRAFEYTVAAHLRDQGYIVIRAAGSKGVADLVALKKGQTLLVSCKIGGPGAVGRLEWNGFLRSANRVGALAIVAWRPRRGGVSYDLVHSEREHRQRATQCCDEWTPDEVTYAEVGEP